MIVKFCCFIHSCKLSSCTCFAPSRSSLHHFKYCTASFFICVDAANEAVYELVAEPVQEPQAEEQQEETIEHAPKEVANPADLRVKPRSITLILSIQCLFK